MPQNSLTATTSLLSAVLSDVKTQLKTELTSSTTQSTPVDTSRSRTKRGRSDDNAEECRDRRSARLHGNVASAAHDAPLLTDVLETLADIGPLDTLTAEDWDVVLHPMAELRPYLQSTAVATATSGATSAADGLVNYVKCRAAELPMRLQIEAQQLRRHEQTLRGHTKELIHLSEFLCYVDQTMPAELDGSGTHGLDGISTTRAVAEPASLLLSTSEAPRRIERTRDRVRELENLIRDQAEEKVRCAERMVLLSAMTALLWRHATTEVTKGTDTESSS